MEPRVEVVVIATFCARTTRRDPEVVRQIITTAHATRREFEPVREYTTAVVGRIVSEQPVQTVLLFTPASLATEHLLVLVPVGNTHQNRTRE